MRACGFLTLRLMACALLASCLALPAEAKWGADINAGAGPTLIEDVAPVLLRIVKAPAAAREGLIEKAVKDIGLPGIEALKRFRNPELAPFYLALARHAEWTVRHRALYALEYFAGTEGLEAALAQVGAAEPRLREKAVITCIKLWDGRKLPATLEERLTQEDDFHVRRCLDALVLHVGGKLPFARVHTEHVERRPDGLLLTPFLSGMNNASKVAPGYTAKANARQGGGSATKLPPADRWVRPLLGYGNEVVSGTSLQPFANLRQNGAVYHTGHDVGASLDGAGYYAPAAGIVKLIHTGSDMGTMLVVEHHMGAKALVNSVYMHGGSAVFVKAGQRVTCGQLLGTMGMSYSIENGGHYAHLHYGMYPGPFSMTHNYGYKPVKAGLSDWYDPAAFLAAWTARTQPIVPEMGRAPPALAKARALLAKGAYGAAYAAAESVKSASGAYAERMIKALEAAPAEALKRVERLRADGLPADALRLLGTHAKSLAGIPGAEALTERFGAWKKDKGLKAELQAEKAYLSTVKKTARAKDPAKALATWRKLLEKHKDSPVASRIRAKIEAK